MTIEPFVQKLEQVLLLDEWKKLMPTAIVGFTTKNGGISDRWFTSFNLGLHVNDRLDVVSANRRTLAELLDFPPPAWVCAEQIHDKNIVKVTKENGGQGIFDYEASIKGTDGLYTDEPDVLLTTCYADCVPLYFLEPERKLIGVAHAGWKGTVKNIGGEMVKKWTEQEGADVNSIHAAIGPAIGKCCYVVDDHVIHLVKKALPSSETVPYRTVSKGQYALDLKLLNKLLLVAAGVPPENILVSSYCTSCESGMFFSHRRDHGKTGRMLSFIGMKK
ncbi:conserved hypothetical protein [Evansella caseinilytica]|uniref:Purine nucleoside phosphorylase n=1 Tax=Evansella caseinilytica TaxID=1503961 RepID=A0A1H3QVR7_9BACI|nr:peptidoglycan editing factor PgeF [Evansella caseinilytica]SDZ17151.1 conserved hypothetical protein [Evansella caseinilytica]